MTRRIAFILKPSHPLLLHVEPVIVSPPTKREERNANNQESKMTPEELNRFVEYIRLIASMEQRIKEKDQSVL
jgi:hypothetical protein